jgi:hypothetical protein
MAHKGLMRAFFERFQHVCCEDVFIFVLLYVQVLYMSLT